MSDFNYFVGQGKVSLQNRTSGPDGVGDGTWFSVGDADTLELNFDQQYLEHFESMSGTKSLALRVPTQRSGTFNLKVQNWSSEMLTIALLGTKTTATGVDTIEAWQTTTKEYMLKFEAVNMASTDQSFTVYVDRISLDPTKALALIGTTVGALELSGALLPDDSVPPKWMRIVKD